MPENVPTEFAEKSTTRQLRDIAMARTADPILSFDYIKGDLGIAHATFHRSVRHLLPVIQLSTRRFGVRRSDYEAWKQARVKLGMAD